MPELSLTNEQALAIDKMGGVAVSQGDAGTAVVILQDLSKVEVPGTGQDVTEIDAPPDLSVRPYAETEDPRFMLSAVIAQLRRPFTPAAVKWKVQASFGKPPHTALIVGYIDARLVTERLNTVCPAAWYEGSAANPGAPPFEPVNWSSGGMLCRLTVCGVTRQDVGNGKDAKSMVSDSLKRAAVKFGIGVSVYATPQVRLQPESGYVKVYGRGEKQSLVLTDAGREYLPKFYTRWLWEHGVDAFGLPLDHGDSSLSVGDVDAGIELTADEDAEVPEAVQEGLEGLSAAVKNPKGKAK